MPRIAMQATVPELMNGTVVDRHRQLALGQRKGPHDAVCKTLGHSGDQVRVLQHIAQGHIVGQRQAKAPV
jgi:hypothetical protein